MVRRPAGRKVDLVRSVRGTVRAAADAFARTFPRTRNLLLRNRVLVSTIVLIAVAGVVLANIDDGVDSGQRKVPA